MIFLPSFISLEFLGTKPLRSHISFIKWQNIYPIYDISISLFLIFISGMFSIGHTFGKIKQGSSFPSLSEALQFAISLESKQDYFVDSWKAN